jgi:hypothetical protein
MNNIDRLNNIILDSNVPTLKRYLESHPNINLNRKTSNNEKVLCLAVTTGKINKVRLLLKYGANPNVTCGNDDNTPLHIAACQGPVSILELLLKSGANPNIWDASDQTPMHVIFECDKGARTKRSHDVLKLLLKYGANPFLKNNKGRTFYNYVRLPILNASPAIINLVKKKVNNKKKAVSETMSMLPQNVQSRILGMANISKNTVLEKEKAAPKIVGAIKAVAAGKKARAEYGQKLQERVNRMKVNKQARNQLVNMLRVKNNIQSRGNLFKKLKEARSRASTEKEFNRYFNIIYNKFIKNTYPIMREKNINLSRNVTSEQNFNVTERLLGREVTNNIAFNRLNLRKKYRKLRNPQKLKSLIQKKTFKKKLTNKEVLKMLSNQNTRINNVNNVMKRLPVFKYTGTDPRTFENVGVNNLQGIWTKPQWVTYLALSLQKRYQTSYNLPTSINWAINKGLRSTLNRTTRNRIRQRVVNLKEKNFVTLMDIYNLMNMFPIEVLANIGY